MKLLLDHGAKPNARLGWTARPQQPLRLMVGETPLHLAAIAGQTNAVLLLVERGANLHGTNGYGLTPLGLLEAGDGLGGMAMVMPGIVLAYPAYRVAGKNVAKLPPKPASRTEVIYLLRSLEAEAKAGLTPSAPAKQP